MELRLKNLVKDFPGTRAVDTGELTILDGKLTGLLGPSGCGKSTLLYLISGLQKPTSGRIYFGDRDVTDLPPEKREIGLVFQNYALYPHMTVAQNIAFPLVNRKVKKAEIQERTAKMAALVQIEELLNRKPSQLSGGQQQRVAIARALVKRPEILLLDEPLSNLDARLRLEMREEIRRIQTETGVTTVFVTHDQEEAMSITDEIILMKKGVVQQQCDPQRMYLDPANQFVASFLGSPPIDYFHFPVRDGRLWITESYSLPMNIRHDGGILTGIRPEAWGRGNDLQVQIQTVEHRGKETLVTFVLAGTKTRALLDITDTVRPGDTIGLTLRTRFLYLFDEDSGIRLRQEEEK
ncbi:ABC transporter ATP-binding protein [Oscillibacter valericigenes]|uniref:ABC transporter ATP-binding protein n=1 Tax=Oscillibacter valericigenes TaxID=351091 RepID=UPI001957EBAC|nr:ABC transporter ATP-binding protein [Oscillibacter valericigenes]MBM6910642.1 ABC transporter ATP-binding protein [Oscillibacter valericigenes]